MSKKLHPCNENPGQSMQHFDPATIPRKQKRRDTSTPLALLLTLRQPGCIFALAIRQFRNRGHRNKAVMAYISPNVLKTLEGGDATAQPTFGDLRIYFAVASDVFTL